MLLPAVVALSSAFVGASAPFAQADSVAGARTVVVVGTGDTLWSVAERVAPARDPREVVAALERANRLGSAVVLPGSRLDVPADLGR